MRSAHARFAAVLAATAFAASHGDARADDDPDASPALAPHATDAAADADADVADAGSTAGLYQQHAPAAEVAGAPRPDRSSGIAREQRSGARHLIWVPRVVLFPVKWTMWVAFAPVRGALYLYERYRLDERFYIWFFNDQRTFGIYPLAFFETGFGLNAGARVVHKDLAGQQEQLTLRASYGGRYRQLYRASLDSGQRLGRLSLGIETDYNIQPHTRFFGIGNLDEVSNDDPLATPPASPTEVATRTLFHQDIVRAALVAGFELAPELALSLSTAYTRREFGPPSGGSGAPIDEVYAPDALVGWTDGLSSVVTELELVYDTRRSSHRFVWAQSRGWRLDAFASYRHGVGDDSARYFRYGVDAQRLIDLYHGDRVLVLRAYTEAVSSAVDETPFVELPRLGGPLLLRGYSRDRFRDRALALGTAEYQWALARNISAFAFADYGGVFRRYADADPEQFRLGFGAGLQNHGKDGFQLRIHAASSIDGGIFLALSFDPIFEIEPRIERK